MIYGRGNITTLPYDGKARTKTTVIMRIMEMRIFEYSFTIRGRLDHLVLQLTPVHSKSKNILIFNLRFGTHFWSASLSLQKCFHIILYHQVCVFEIFRSMFERIVLIDQSNVLKCLMPRLETIESKTFVSGSPYLAICHLE